MSKETETSELFGELRQICAQYAREVPKKRRPWPESIKSRVMRLRFLGVSNHRIAQEIGIPVMTLYCWKMPAPEKARLLPEPAASGGEFVPVRVVKRPTGLVAARDQRRSSGRSRTLTVKAASQAHAPTTVTVKIDPDGAVRIEGLTASQALEVARGLSR